ncbi:hypothetical protein Arth_3455 [Arthrobacter sp. FB24]|uniref:hypothetical protein n=1 Tax=Arthrobacter sp. (strain FB24) TaxID=290399 RepID=UPI0000526DEA|nr:hypothetical protein [Arthrobacter sp. FB24]ABK04830.1 hypothetical protein Arth_3455 [Arthrobacter sp. FB24]
MTSPGEVPAAPGSASSRPGLRPLRWAWIAVAAIPVAFVAGMLIGEGLLTLQGYTGEDSVPPGVVALAAGPALLLILAPELAAAVLGFRARGRGEARGLIPAVIGIVAAAFSIITNTLPLLFRLG